MRDHVGFAEGAQRFERHQFRIARTDADAEQFSRAHRPGLARALTAAAVMALPPMRPRTIEKRNTARIFGKRGFRFRGADKADRNAEDGGRFRRAGVNHIEQSEQGRRRIADGDHRAGETIAPQIERRRRARRGVARGERRRARIVERADHLVARRQPRARNAARDHFDIAQDRRAGVERAACRRDEVRGRTRYVAPYRLARRRGSCAPRRRLPPAKNATGRPRRG